METPGCSLDTLLMCDRDPLQINKMHEIYGDLDVRCIWKQALIAWQDTAATSSKLAPTQFLGQRQI